MYRHGIYVSEQETSMIAPLNGTAGLQVVIGTAPVHLLADPAAAINKPLLPLRFFQPLLHARHL